MAHIVVHGVVRITDAVNSKEFHRTGIKNTMENEINDNDDEDATFTEVSMSATYGFVKRHPDLKTGTPKNLDINKLAVVQNVYLPEEQNSLLSQTKEIWAYGSGWMDNKCFKRNALTILLSSIIERRKRMSLENEHILFLLDSHASRADPSIWREFQEQQVDVLTFVPHSTHLCQPLDRGVFAEFKSELTYKFEASSSSSSSKRAAISDVLPQAIHTALSPSVIQKAFVCSGVLHNSFGPDLLKLL
ncbi:uncharacterized protein MONOS_15476 [Monocercomonoides exilis]|uniref:uncharacterized protein n=1 Tax=Monocercomonoides exilis TaxID=2049356 RepID=UPI00355A2C83|nr:hypothetical protein MONOS_15476 [Monocercomonoides exilis]|eukprot:MONOS_15476.1-p1 / transcript=MONOS_15476.1 / gene=MONOS_15476 / organism=Monocercomonoides_exilis_PA203 / gene_product=unspecified product / transcript_product=unspecified product / location=Mono_scaffold01243:10095-11272(+) / protein_length=245 / sequence_SO=supercontig / SO=protein_coding / is_pseudo=false